MPEITTTRSEQCARLKGGRSLTPSFLLIVIFVMVLMTGCSGAQSALNPTGREAERIAQLFWWMTAGAVVIWLIVIVLAVYAARVRPEAFTPRRGRQFIVWGGAVVPTVVLSGLLIYGLALLPDLLAQAPAGSLKISVIGEQYWWRVRYRLPDGATIELANEIRLPVGEPVEFQLEGNDVIHSFWIPSLAGKVDMIPGRVTRLTLRPTQTGTFRGVCAEYCGTAHALMAFPVVVLGKDEFARWLAEQRAPAVSSGEVTASRGQQLFLATGCGACHTIRGSQAAGVIGPDLTHVGSRLTLGAGILPNEPEVFRQWIARPNILKPGALMPAFGMLPEDDLRALAVYLEGLR